MRFKPSVWFPIAVLAAGLNVVGAWFALRTDEQFHALAHLVAAIGLGLWAASLHNRLRAGEPAQQQELPAYLESLEAELTTLRQELSETQERLDFTERLLAQRHEAERVNQDR